LLSVTASSTSPEARISVHAQMSVMAVSVVALVASSTPAGTEDSWSAPRYSPARPMELQIAVWARASRMSSTSPGMRVVTRLTTMSPPTWTTAATARETPTVSSATCQSGRVVLPVMAVASCSPSDCIVGRSGRGVLTAVAVDGAANAVL
jgi:hypothetical protein